jgi:glycosyltransferase involved in cell wall biosynthesis
MAFRDLAWESACAISQTKILGLPRKIVFVSDTVYPYMKGGKEKRMHEITKRLAARGHDVHIYTMHWWDSAEKSRVENGVQLHAICKYYELYNGDRRTIKQGILFGVACLKLLRIQFDVLDVDHMPFFPIFSIWLICTLRRRKFYGTWHEALTRKDWTSYMGVKGNIAAVLEHLSIHLPHYITAASAQTKELLATVHGRERRVDLVSSGVDIQLLKTIQPAQVRCDVLYVGRLVKDKNVDKLIAAIGLLANQQADIRCIIIGKGPEKTRLQQQAARGKLKKCVEFREPLSEAEVVYSYMKAAKVFCTPSVREGFGIVTLEALACGTPVVTADTPANAARHLIQDGQNGSIVPPDPQALADAIIQWVSLPEKPDTIIDAPEYDWHSIAEKQAEVYAV